MQKTQWLREMQARAQASLCRAKPDDANPAPAIDPMDEALGVALDAAKQADMELASVTLTRAGMKVTSVTITFHV
jgi:hypothetical protein